MMNYCLGSILREQEQRDRKGASLIINRLVKAIGGVTICLLICQSSWAEQKFTWADCLRQAAQGHPDLVSAKEGIRQSKDTRDITASSLWPQAQANISATRSKTNSGTGFKTDSTSYDYGATGSQLLFDSFKTTNSVKASAENIKVSQWNFQFVSSQVRSRLRIAFVNLLKAQELIELTKQIYDIRKQSLDLIAKSYSSGMEHKGAFLTAQANLAEAEFEIHQAHRSLEVAQRNLLKEIGAKTKEPVKIDGTFEVGADYAQKPALETLVDSHPQLLGLIAQKKAAFFNVNSDQSNFWPSISVTGGVGKNGEQWPPSTANTNVGLTSSWSLLEGGSRGAQLDRDESVIRGLEAQEQSLRDGLVLALEQAWSNLQDAIEQVSVQKNFLEADQERAKIAAQQYSIGLLTFDNRIIIEDNLVNSKKSLLNTQASALLAEASWIEAQGRTLENANE